MGIGIPFGAGGQILAGDNSLQFQRETGDGERGKAKAFGATLTGRDTELHPSSTRKRGLAS